MATRLLEQEPPHRQSLEVTVDLVLRPIRQGATRRPQLLAEDLLGIAMRSPPRALGASLSLRLFRHDDFHGSASS
jgi:hypothetical protein